MPRSESPLGFFEPRTASGVSAMRALRGPILPTVLLVTLLVVLVPLVIDALEVSTNPWRGPGEHWERGFLAGEEILLLDSGRFVHREWCDVCGDMPQSTGTWEQRGNTVLLHPEAAELGFLRSWTLHRVEDGGCTYLVESGSGLESPSRSLDAFEPAGPSCQTR